MPAGDSADVTDEPYDFPAAPSVPDGPLDPDVAKKSRSVIVSGKDVFVESIAVGAGSVQNDIGAVMLLQDPPVAPEDAPALKRSGRK